MKTIAAVVAVLSVVHPASARAQLFERDVAAGARSLETSFDAFKRYRITHKSGILQQIDAAMAHLTAESKPAVVMLVARTGSGTGFFVDRGGLIATNAHVAELAGGRGGTLTVLLNDGTELSGKVVAIGDKGAENQPMAGRDLALVQVSSPRRDWPALGLGDTSALREGQLVVGLGYPLGNPFSVAQGVVSGLDHREGVRVKFVQTDAPINPGNSGGPLLASDGRVVGVDTFIMSPSGGSIGVGFAIRVEALKDFLAQYRRTGSFDESSGRARGMRTASARCPAPEQLVQPWVEHAGVLPAARLKEHLAASVDAAAPVLLPVEAVSWWLGGSRRGRGDGAQAPACFALGSAAVYVIGPEWAPAYDFARAVEEGAESSLAPRLIELRWYDARDGRKHRWYNVALARELGWDSDGRGAPASARPVPLPQAVNELL